jgi:uncharacterized protein
VLRGFALCGILLLNVRPIAARGAFVPASPEAPAAVPEWPGLLLDQRFFPIFALLFGIGFALLTGSASARDARPRRVLLRRLLALLALGLVHMFLLWPGDILTTYAVVGLLVLLPSTWLPRRAVAGLAAVVLAAALVFAHGGNALVPGLFLLGAALVRYGVVERIERSTRVPALLGLAFAAAAVPAVWWQVRTTADAAGDAFPRAMAVAGLLMAGLYVCGLLVLLRTPLRRVLRAVFEPLGRMALTNYLTATVLVLAAAELVGDAWSGTAGSGITVYGVAGAVLALQWVWSTVWLRRYRQGPLEWLWRWATWSSRPPLRRTA